MFELKMNYFLPQCVLQIKNTKQKLYRKDISHLKIVYLKNVSDCIINTKFKSPSEDKSPLHNRSVSNMFVLIDSVNIVWFLYILNNWIIGTQMSSWRKLHHKNTVKQKKFMV